MSTCNLGFEHEDPEPVIVEEAPDLEPAAEAEVRIAEIQAGRDVAVAKIEHRAIDEDTVAVIAGLRAENEALRAAAAPPEQEQEAVVVVADPEPGPGPAAEPEPPAAEPSAEPEARKRKNAWWG